MPRQGSRAGSPIYDLKTETTTNGMIQEVKEIAGPGRGTGTHLVVKAVTGVIEVHVGPTRYLKEQKCELKKGMQLEILGSKVNLAGAEVIIAKEIKEGTNTWTLRDAQGVPAWSRRGNRQGVVP